MSQCYLEPGLSTSRRYDQCRDVPERVYSQRHDVKEGCIFKFATLGSNAATLQKIMLSTSRH